MSRYWFGLRYYVSFLLFGVMGIVVNLVCAPLLLWPRRQQLGRPVRRLIRSCFRFWLWWLRFTRVVDVRWSGFAGRPAFPPGTIYVGNHPTLIDATLLLARLDDAICIFKARLLHSPFIAPAALLAGYLASNRPDVLRAAAASVSEGRSLLIFPEGTRTARGAQLNPLKPGFSVIARQTKAAVHVLRLRSSPDLLPRGRAWWRLPREPMWVEISREAIIEPREFQDPRRAVRRVEQRLRGPLAAGMV
jgi:1-acyl-sn-glycerol-3-phosphate acyltransferase